MNRQSIDNGNGGASGGDAGSRSIDDLRKILPKLEHLDDPEETRRRYDEWEKVYDAFSDAEQTALADDAVRELNELERYWNSLSPEEQRAQMVWKPKPHVTTPFEVTRVEKAKGRVTKKISRNPDGPGIKSNSTQCLIGMGKMHRVKVNSLQDFGRMITETPDNAAWVLGVLDEKWGDSTPIVAKKDPRSTQPCFATRTKTNVEYRAGTPALILADHDTKGMPASVKARLKECGGFKAALTSICPEIAKAGTVWRPSTSSGISDIKTGESFANDNGHLYVLIEDGADAGRFIETLHERAYLAGFGWIGLSKRGAALKRSIIDIAVRSGERLVFEAVPDLDQGLKQEPRPADVCELPPLNSKRACIDLDASERAEFARRIAADTKVAAPASAAARRTFNEARRTEMSVRGIAPDRIKTTLERLDKQVLGPTFELDPVDLPGSITVADLLADPERFDGEDFYDPIEGRDYGHPTAKFYADNLIIHSFAHGGSVFKLQHDYELIEAEIEKGTQSAERLCKLIIDTELNPIEEDQLAGMIAKHCHTTKAAVKSMISSGHAKQNAIKRGKMNEDDVARLNKEFTYLYGQGVLRMMHDRELNRDYYDICKTQMMREMFANEPRIVVKGDHIVEVTVFDVWMASPNRNQYLGGSEFRPSALPFEILPRYADRIKKYGTSNLPRAYTSPPDVLNFWSGFGVVPKAGSWKKLFDHIYYVICDGNRVAFVYVICWMAYAVQFPERQGETVLALRGKEGCGKGIFARNFIKLFGRHGLQIVQPQHLVGRFNLHLRDVCALFADECFFAGNPEHTRILKGITTEPTIAIEGKYINVVPMANRLHIIMATNDDWMVDASLEARRYAVFDVNDSRINDFAYFKAIQDELDNGGLEAMLYDLSHLPLVRFNVRDIPKTKGLAEQKKQSLSVPDQWLMEVLARGYVWETQLGCTTYFHEWHETVTTALLFKSYERFAQKRHERRPLNRITIGNFLKLRGFELVEKMSHDEGVIDERRGEVVNVESREKNSGKVEVVVGTAGQPVLHHTRTSGYSMGTWEQARAAFEAALKLKIDWSEHEDHDLAGSQPPPEKHAPQSRELWRVSEE